MPRGVPYIARGRAGDVSVDIIANGNGCGRKWRKRFRSRTRKSGKRTNERRRERQKRVRKKKVGMKGENEEEARGEQKWRGKEKERERQRKRETSMRCGGRQVSGCARFTLAFANGDTLRRKGERANLFSPQDEEERGRAREKRGASGSEGGFAPKKRVTRHVIPALPLLFVAPGARARYPGPDPTRGYTEKCRTRAHPPTMGRATIYYSRASWHLTCRLAASLFRFSFCRPVDLLVSFSLSFFLAERVVSVHVSSWVDRSPRLRPQLRNKVRVRGGANSSPWRS